MSKAAPGVRYAEVERETRETRVQIVLDLDGGSRRDIATGLGFLDHMLELMAFHGSINLGIEAEGDLTVDDHHTVEDVGIVLGQAIREALEGGDSIERYGHATVPMDEALVLVAIDVSGRGQLFFDPVFKREKIGDMATENVREFFRAVAMHSRLTVHVKQLAGENDHHICEAAFKAFGLALNSATRMTERRGSSSTKGKRD
jgi:imidazoleglycerol-phosphate dehydratase